MGQQKLHDIPYQTGTVADILIFEKNILFKIQIKMYDLLVNVLVGSNLFSQYHTNIVKKYFLALRRNNE